MDGSQNKNGAEKAAPSYLDGAIDAVWKRDENAQGPVAQDYLKDLLKTVPLFMGGRVALVGAAALNALDQAKPSDSAGTQLLDGSLGAAKGASTKLMFDKLGGMNTSFVTKGVAMGITARTLDVGLTRQSYLENGQFSLMHGLKETAGTTFGAKNLAADLVITGMGLGAMKGLGSIGMAQASESRLLGTVLSGTVFGGSSGAYQEFNRQTALGEFNPLGLAKETFLHAGIGGLGAAPGGFQSALRFSPRNFGPISPEQNKANLERLYDPVEKMGSIRERTFAKRNYDSQYDLIVNGTGDFQRPVREYSIVGHDTKLQVPVAYDNALPKYRQWRELANQPMTGSNWLQVAMARIRVDASPMRGRFLPEDLVSSLDRTPDSSMIKEIQVLGTRDPYYGLVNWRPESGGAIAEKLPNGKLVFYRPVEGALPTGTLQHEWSHIQHDANKPAFAAYHAALKLEEYGFDHRGYAKYNVNENWAVSSEPLLGASDKAFKQLVEQAPVRASVLGRALQEALNAVPPDRRGVNFDQLQQRVQYIKENAEPKARQVAARGGNADANRAGDIIKEFLDGKVDNKRAQEILGLDWQYDYYRE